METLAETIGWSAIMNLFNYNRGYVQLGSSQFIVSPPGPVRKAVDVLRKANIHTPLRDDKLKGLRFPLMVKFSGKETESRSEHVNTS